MHFGSQVYSNSRLIYYTFPRVQRRRSTKLSRAHSHFCFAEPKKNKLSIARFVRIVIVGLLLLNFAHTVLFKNDYYNLYKKKI